MSDEPAQHRLYTDLAVWWPLISPPAEYQAEAAYFASVLDSATTPVRDVLELGSGGGHNAVHLTAAFTLTLVDLSEDMLAMSRRLNPGCVHHLGDMRTVRLGRSFDAVFVHDAVDYLTSEDDLRRTAETAYMHCGPGGVAVFVPDVTAETFTEVTEPRRQRRTRRSRCALPGLGLGPRSHRHLDADRVRLPAPRRGRHGADRARDTPDGAVRGGGVAPTAW